MTRAADPHPNPLPRAGEGEIPPLPRAGEGWGRSGAFEPHAASPLSDSGLQAGVRTASEGGARIAQITSAQLFGSAREVQIDHHGAVYRLKQTSLGKLILTK